MRGSQGCAKHELPLHPLWNEGAEIKAVTQARHQSSQRPASREFDAALLKFVEALAIADARRDHLVASQRISTSHVNVASKKCISEIGQDEARSNLCSVLDRASERKID